MCFRSLGVCLLLICLTNKPTISAEDLSDLIEAIPRDANTMTIIDYSVLRESQWAKENGVQIGDLVGAPDSLRYLVLAADVDYNFMTTDRQFAFVEFKGTYSLSTIVDNGGIIDSIAGRNFVWLDGTTAVVALKDQVFALGLVSGRQQIARYIRNLSVAEPDRSSEFLRFAITQAAKEKNLAVIAFDLQDAISPETIRQAVLQTSMFDDLNRDEMSNLLAGVEGAVITVQATDKLSAKIQLRFKDNAQPLKDLDVRLVDAFLRDMGAKLVEIEKWEGEVVDKVVTLQGPLSLESLEDLLGAAIYDSRLPTQIRSLSNRLASEKPRSESGNSATKAKSAPEIDRSPASSESANESSSSAELKAEATSEFLGRVRRILRSLQNKTDETIDQSRYWLDRYAFRLQYLSRENVDSQLLEFADNLTRRLRGMAEELENAHLKAAEQFESGWIATPTYDIVNYGGVRIRRRAYYYGNWGWGKDATGVDRLQARKILSDAVISVKDAGISIVQDFNEMGQRMAHEHGLDFERWTPGKIE